MPIHVRQNQYKGVNAHLHSIFQRRDEEKSPSMWPSFHSYHIIHLADALNAVLPDRYQAIPEQSLQILSGNMLAGRPRPDLTIYGNTSGAYQGEGAGLATLAPTYTTRVVETMAEPEEVFAVMVYDHTPETVEHEELGKPVTRIELFSPANKPGGSYYGGYQSNRRIALESGLVLVEIDYLHEKPSPIHSLPVYPNDANAYPYSITISDPRLPADSKSVFSFGFSVDAIIPTLNIPLVDEAFVSLAFDEVYQHTFEAGRWGYQVDYEQEPERIESYREDDQQRILTVMQAVKAKSL